MILNVMMQKQLMDEWCWAAVASSVSFYYYNNAKGLYQSDIAGQIITPVCAQVDSSNAANYSECDQPQDLGIVMQKIRNYAWEQPNPLSMGDIATQINGGFPVCCQINWTGVPVAHYVIIYGLDGNNLLIGDPAANNYWADYNYLTGNFSNSGGRWNRTIATQAIQ